jgi:hypothetical protein
MYGALELAEQINSYGLKEVRRPPRIPIWKYGEPNSTFPLDARTPSYTDASEAAQKNIPEMWSFDFWQEYIDNLARYRFNLISLWSLHPFPSMVRVPGYEDIALERCTAFNTKWQEHYDLEATGLDAPEILEQCRSGEKDFNG